MPITQTSVPVQFEDVFQAFDAKTRKSIDQNLVGFGDTLAGRGSALNDTFASLPRLLTYLEPVTRYLADPSTELTRFLNSLEGFMGTRRARRGDQRAAVHGYGDDLRGFLARSQRA